MWKNTQSRMKTRPSKIEKAALEPLLKHARKFGTAQVMETAIEDGFELAALVLLQEELDKVDAAEAKKRRFGGPYKKPRLTAEARVKRLLGIEEDEKGD